MFLFLMAVQIIGHAQNTPESSLILNQATDSVVVEIQLSATWNESRTGVWENGDYKIYVEIAPLEETFRNESGSLIHILENQLKEDSVTAARYKMYAERYAQAANQLQAAENGFDLRSLVVYVGPDNAEANKGSSHTVDVYVRQCVENGNARVMYKGERIFTLKKQIRWNYILSDIRIYYNQMDNCAYNYIGHINW